MRAVHEVLHKMVLSPPRRLKMSLPIWLYFSGCRQSRAVHRWSPSRCGQQYGFHLPRRNIYRFFGIFRFHSFWLFSCCQYPIPEFLCSRLWYKNLNFRLGGHLAAPAQTTWPPPVGHKRWVELARSIAPKATKEPNLRCV